MNANERQRAASAPSGPSPVWYWNSSECDDEQLSFAECCLRHPIFGELFHRETFKVSEIIRPQGSSIEEFGIVVDGCLKAVRYTFDGTELCSTYFEKDDVFPGLLYFAGDRLYSYNLVAVKKTSVMWLDTLHFELMLKTDERLMYRFMLYLSGRGLRNQKLLTCLQYHTVRERIAFWLVQMADVSRDGDIQTPLSQGVWANELRVSRPSLNQELKRMEEQGLFRIRGRRLEAIDFECLEALL